jgi:hypothetical protein
VAQIGGQLVRGSRGRRWKRPDHDQIASAPTVDVLSTDRSEAAGDSVPSHGVTDRLAHDEADPSRLWTLVPGPHVEDESGTRSTTSTPNGSSEVDAPAHPMGRGQHRSGSEAVAALTAARRKDGAAGAGAHPKTEAVGLGPTPVVGLERTLRHERLRGLTGGAGRGQPPLGRSRLNIRQTEHHFEGRTSPRAGCEMDPQRPTVQRGGGVGSNRALPRPERVTFQCFKRCYGGGGDTPVGARYGGSCCGQPLDSLGSAR